MSATNVRNKIEYVVACVSEFAQAHDLSHPSAFDYLDKFKGLDFLFRCYNVEHLQSFVTAVDDLEAVCRKNGGYL